MDDPYNLRRFVAAQDAVEFGEPIYVDACSELRRGRKASHWMWFIFPQLKGLGSSPMAVKFAIGSIAEAQAYIQHSVLGERLRECSNLLLQIEGRPIDEIMRYPDNLKLKSSMTLFSRATPHNEVFLQVLAKYFEGHPDPSTIEALSTSSR